MKSLRAKVIARKARYLRKYGTAFSARTLLLNRKNSAKIIKLQRSKKSNTVNIKLYRRKTTPAKVNLKNRITQAAQQLTQQLNNPPKPKAKLTRPK